MVPRENTKELFESHNKKTTYPQGFGVDNMRGTIKLKDQMDEMSMLKGIPEIKSAEVDRDLSKMGELKYEPAFEQIVKHDIDKM